MARSKAAQEQAEMVILATLPAQARADLQSMSAGKRRMILSVLVTNADEAGHDPLEIDFSSLTPADRDAVLHSTSSIQL